MTPAQKIYEILSNYNAYDPHEYSAHHAFNNPGVKVWSKITIVGSSTYRITAALENKYLHFYFERNGSFSSNPVRTKEEIQNETQEFLQVFPQIQRFFFSVYQQIKKDIIRVEFHTLREDYSRIKLYDHIASRLAKQFNMIFNKVKSGEFITYQLVPKT